MRPESESENIVINVIFSCLHVHGSYAICATWEGKKIGIGALEHFNVNTTLSVLMS